MYLCVCTNLRLGSLFQGSPLILWKRARGVRNNTAALTETHTHTYIISSQMSCLINATLEDAFSSDGDDVNSPRPPLQNIIIPIYFLVVIIIIIL